MPGPISDSYQGPDSPSVYPIRSPVLRRSLARRDICPECGGCLDTGWECNDCGYDAKPEATSIPPRSRR